MKEKMRKGKVKAEDNELLREGCADKFLSGSVPPKWMCGPDRTCAKLTTGAAVAVVQFGLGVLVQIFREAVQQFGVQLDLQRRPSVHLHCEIIEIPTSRQPTDQGGGAFSFISELARNLQEHCEWYICVRLSDSALNRSRGGEAGVAGGGGAGG